MPRQMFKTFLERVLLASVAHQIGLPKSQRRIMNLAKITGNVQLYISLTNWCNWLPNAFNNHKTTPRKLLHLGQSSSEAGKKAVKDILFEEITVNPGNIVILWKITSHDSPHHIVFSPSL
ncbi:uncharacterized protein LOC126739182 [Anthonomus grandis grandis]|uniref:uncharacterized protein LOC126739182 n=1 Tax=Anthonomus grandis grandis TaxID=2921223 RepID=UPI0021665C33|nr:uncharacterized protein LOC126739182 [Anthonomus grandis grandis]